MVERKTILDAESEERAATVLPSAGEREPLLLVGVEQDAVTMERAAFTLASAKRNGKGANALANFATNLLLHADKAEGQLFQDLFVLHFLNFKRGGYFVEVGTGDGKLISNTYLLEKEYGWKGIVVEPNPVFKDSLLQNRNCTISTDCLLDVKGRSVTFNCQADPEFSGISSEYLGTSGSSLGAEHAARRPEDLKKIVFITNTLNDLLTEHEAPTVIDYLSLDVEGAEFPILRTFDFEKWEVRCISVEHNWSPMRVDMNELLVSKGFCRVFEEISQWDDWYVQRSLLDGRDDAAQLLRTDDTLDDAAQANAFVTRAIEALDRGEPDVAIALCERAAVLAPASPSVYRTLADIAQRQGRPAAAIEHWKQAISTDPADYWAHIGLAEVYLARGQIEEACGLLIAATKLRESPAEAESLLRGVRTGGFAV